MQWNLTNDGRLLTLDSMDEWNEFVEANSDWLVDEYGSADNALRHCRDGGLRLGGGALPITDVVFVE